METFIGTVLTVAFGWAPRGWTACNGQLLPIAQNQALFALVSFTYGGDGRTTFGVPDLRGRTPFGVGQGPGLQNNSPIGTAVGTDTTTLSLANMPAHTHAATVQWQQGSQQVAIPATPGTLNVAVTTNATSTGGSTGTPSASTNMLAGAGTGKIYGATTAANLVPLGGTTVAVTGNAPTAATTATVQTLTGGTVTNAVAGASQSFTNMQPSLALNFIIALEGIYPNRP